MSVITLEEAQAKLSDLVHRLLPGQEVIITENDRPIARLVVDEKATQWPCKAGSARGKIWISDDFDEPLEDFKEYME